MKGLGLLHKSEHQAVRPDVRSGDEAACAFAALRSIPGVGGMLVQRQVKGVERIIGLSREGAFGHLVLVGIGGVFAEVLGDTAVKLAPVDRQDARRMIASLRGGQAARRGSRTSRCRP